MLQQQSLPLTSSSMPTNLTNQMAPFSLLLSTDGMKHFFLHYIIPDFFTPREIIQIFCSHHFNHDIRNEILALEWIWDLQFKYLFPTLYEMKNQLLTKNWWTRQRQVQLNELLDLESKPQLLTLSDNGENLLPFGQQDRTDFTPGMVRINCRNEVLSLIFGICVDHSFYETNFKIENRVMRNKKRAKNFDMFRFFYDRNGIRMQSIGHDIKTNRLHSNTISDQYTIHNIMQKVFSNTDKKESRFQLIQTLKNKYEKLYESLLVDMIFKSNMPLTAYSLLKKGYTHSLPNEQFSNTDETIYFPYIDFSLGQNRGYYCRFFQIHPHVTLNEEALQQNNNGKPTQLRCLIKYQSCVYYSQIIVEESKQVIYPRDLNVMTKTFETFCILTQEAMKVQVPFHRLEGNAFYHDFQLDKTPNSLQDVSQMSFRTENLYFTRPYCMNSHYCVRILYQKRVDQLVHAMMKHHFDRDQLTQCTQAICSELANYPSKQEISHLLCRSSKFQDIFPFDDFQKLSDRLKQKIWKAYRGQFKMEHSLVKSIDKCIRRYIHLFVLSQPHIIEHDFNCFTLPYLYTLHEFDIVTHVCKLVQYRIETVLENDSTAQHFQKQANTSFDTIENELRHVFHQLNFLNEPLLCPSSK
ncbi:hypothetical protein C9374_005629 [Naegleria lovaniensis]|uniref:Uncharacterized protein n=1 Tax=Naegleria lovaniensis TaxID=51637 RepID=A0AA88KIP1_NAELO|nr:uncharacterized protein C9374_005629 [Naegleria lovaniensis]KAG2382427.1 hypothetical protein C9374_005629 [Naegleria lovaniensis]